MLIFKKRSELLDDGKDKSTSEDSEAHGVEGDDDNLSNDWSGHESDDEDEEDDESAEDSFIIILMYVFVFVCMCVYVCMYVCIYNVYVVHLVVMLIWWFAKFGFDCQT